jgi:mono/diheme cytochrome c family protein
MLDRARLHPIFLLAAAGVAALLSAGSARGDARSDEALAAAVRRGKQLYEQSWRPRAKSCRACHARGANKMTGERLKSYPKYDKVFRRVVSAQQKLQQMVKAKGGGTPPALGSEDLNALEAYVATLK